MFTFPSARRFLLPTLLILVLLVFLRLLSETGVLQSSQHALLQAALQAYLSGGGTKVTVLNATTHPNLFTGNKLESDGYRPGFHASLIPQANSLVRQFTQCEVEVNPFTSHIRLQNVLYNISLSPPPSHGRQKRDEDEDEDQDAQQSENTRFFNPAIIPLPYWSHPARYVLVSRVVTSGFHQESHICLADICLPSPDPSISPRDHNTSQSHSQTQSHRRALPPDTRPCVPSDHVHLGPNGGLRCLTSPLKINIPPTPAEKCEDAWLAFPDIPGFHDPRVFWSGKGEPLILVNSASRYGCVGLWIVDLRQVYPQLENVLSRDGRRVGIVAKRDVDDEESGQTGVGKGMQRGAGFGLKPLMSYPHLTEITRNPRASRARVEKNWVLWFPNGEEAYVQYDLLGLPMLEEDETGLDPGEDFEGLARLGLGVNATLNHTYAHATNTTSHKKNSTMLPAIKKRRWAQKGTGGGRTLAQLTGNGFTTTNFTHPNEKPCFSAETGHFKDSLGNTGHWHQGSNSLRLILCTRAQARSDPACRDNDDDDDNKNRSESAGSVESGRSVHFAIMHRKFSNELDLPLRYERYVVVWEGREPFQLLGVSRCPLLMKNEWAKPWTDEENWSGSMKKGRKGWNATTRQPNNEEKGKVRRAGLERTSQPELDEEDDFEKSSSYFTYTPSLAWTWRPHSAAANQEDEDDDVEYMSQLGTGYLGDEVLVGIGLDDVNQAFARVKVDDLLQCLRLCPGVRFAEDGID